MQTAHDSWLEAPYQAAEEAHYRDSVRREALLGNHGWLADCMPIAAENVADDLASALCDKPEWRDADALLLGRVLMDELRRRAEMEVRS